VLHWLTAHHQGAIQASIHRIGSVDTRNPAPHTIPGQLAAGPEMIILARMAAAKEAEWLAT
jgi:hypothetical protein